MLVVTYVRAQGANGGTVAVRDVPALSSLKSPEGWDAVPGEGEVLLTDWERFEARTGRTVYLQPSHPFFRWYRKFVNPVARPAGLKYWKTP